MSRLTVGSIEGLTENSNVISIPTGHTLNAVDGLQIGGTAVGAIQTYTPTWTVPAGSTPTIGNGSLTGKYTVINKWCVGSIRLALGSTSSISGTSEWRFSFPVTPVNIFNFETLGAALAVDVGTAGYRGTAFFLANTIAVYGSDAAATVGSTTPFTWDPSVGDYLTISFSYEVA